jgi:biopolymer transport protein ExbD
LLGCPRIEANRNASFIKTSSPSRKLATLPPYLSSDPFPELSMALNADINVTPMIDVLLVLLVVFMLSMRLRQVLDVNVPPPAQQTSHKRGSPSVVLELKGDGSYAINGVSIPYSGLTTRLRELTEGGQRTLLFVKAAPKRRYREVVEAVDLAKGAGWQIVGYMP